MKKCLGMLVCLAMLCMPLAMAEMQIVTDVAVEAKSAQQVSLTTGMPKDQADRIMAIQMDNEPGARPQMGIGSADIVYEIEIYNGGYTRYTGIFNDNIPELVEAVRSTRMVNIDIAKEYGGVFIHYGKGHNVGDYLASGVKPNVRYDGLEGISGFYRDNSRSAPNNVVCKFRDLYDQTDWSLTDCKSPLKFSDVAYTQKGEPVSSFSIEYRNGYNPSFNYEDGLYKRYYNDNPHKDGVTGEQLSFVNVIVEFAKQTWINDNQVPVVDLYSGNRCEYFIDGLHFTGYYERADVNDNTHYYDADGNEVVFKPGKTFIQILKEGREIEFGSATTGGELKNGSRGDEVLKLQQKLQEMGLLDGNADGVYGNKTAEAVSAAQAQLGLAQTGTADASFLSALYGE